MLGKQRRRRQITTGSRQVNTDERNKIQNKNTNKNTLRVLDRD